MPAAAARSHALSLIEVSVTLVGVGVDIRRLRNHRNHPRNPYQCNQRAPLGGSLTR